MLAVIPVAVLMMSMMVAFVGTTVDSSRANVADMDDFRVRAAAQNAANLAINQLWSDFTAVVGDDPQLWEFRAHLDAAGVPDSNSGDGDSGRMTDLAESSVSRQLTSFADTLGRSVQDVSGEVTSGDLNGAVEKITKLRGIESVAGSLKAQFELIDVCRNDKDRMTIDGVEIESVNISRIDDFDSTSIIIDVDAVTRFGTDGSSKESRASIQEVFSISAPEWEGLDFALLANNINCLLCHTKIDSAERYYNQDAARAGTFDTVRIGSLESIHFRSNPDSEFAGVSLVGGDAIMGDGNTISDWSQFNLSGAKAGPGKSVRKIMEDQFGNALTDELDVFDPDSPSSTANLFLDFHEYGSMTEYTLPESFPSPFPDNGGIDPATGLPATENAGNRIVDDSEFYAAVRGSTGTVSGGNISLIAHGDRITDQDQVAHMRNGKSGPDGLSGVTDGNVYLHGTKSDPLVLNGDIAIDGDVIISGYVKGEGALRARGNVYIASDLYYDDGGGKARTFGTADDGTTNALAIAAGGNIVLADPYRPAFGANTAPADGTKDGSFNFTMDEIAIFNRQEWMKTQPTLPGEEKRVQTGTKITMVDEKVQETYFVTKPNYVWVKTGNKIQKPVYKTIQVSNGQPAPYTEYTSKKVLSHYKWVDEKKKVQQGTKQVKRTRWVATGNKIAKETAIYGNVTEQYPNPYYVEDYTPRYYAFAEGTEVPIHNLEGHFDPSSQHWITEERPGEWDTSILTIADPSDPSDPTLYDANGEPKAVISVVGPTAEWISAEMLEKTLMLEIVGQGNSKELEINATLYSANAIIGTIPDRSSHFNGKLHVNGGIVAADVGLLAPNGTQINYDGRGARQLSITSDEGVSIRRRLSAPRINP